ncbi:MAG: hypothetical protein ABIC04_08580 [Nanoarchaeota archaeon]
MDAHELFKTEESLLKLKHFLKRFEKNIYSFEDFLDRNEKSFVAIHMTDHFPKNGLIKTPHFTFFHLPFHERPLRETLHFALNNVVASVGDGYEWSDTKYGIIIPFELLEKRVFIPNPVDLVIFGNYKLEKGCFIIGREKDVSRHNPGNAKIIAISDNKSPYETVPGFLRKLGYKQYRQAQYVYESEFYGINMQKLEAISKKTGYRLDSRHRLGSFSSSESEFNHIACPITNCSMALENKPEDPTLKELLMIYIELEISYAADLISKGQSNFGAYQYITLVGGNTPSEEIKLLAKRLIKIKKVYKSRFIDSDSPFREIPECIDAFKRIDSSCHGLFDDLKKLNYVIKKFPANMDDACNRFRKEYSAITSEPIHTFMINLRKIFNSKFEHKVLEFAKW